MAARRRSAPTATETRTGPDLFERRGVRDRRLLAALRAVPRAPFFGEPDDHGGSASSPLRLLEVPPPDLVLYVVRALALEPSHRLLVLPAGSGYLAAVLSHLVAQLVTVVPEPTDVPRLRERLEHAARENVRVLVGPLESPPPSGRQYDAILLTRDFGDVPERVLQQLRVGGRLVMPQPAGPQALHLLQVQRVARRQFQREQLGGKNVAPLLGDLLVDAGVCDRETVETAAQQAAERGVTIGEQLVAQQLADEGEIYRALARQRGLRSGSVEALLITADRRLFEQYPKKFLRHNRLLPIRREHDTLVVATCDPNVRPRELAHTLGVPAVQIHLLSPTDYRRMVAAFDLGYTGGGEEEETQAEAGAPPAGATTQDLLAGALDTSLESQFVALFDALLLDAIGERASDLHLECFENEVRVRFRVDGRLRDVPRYRLNARDLTGLVNVVKVSADLDIAERRLPQGGRIRRRVGGRVYDLRVQTQPSLYGEAVVIRLLPQDRKLLSVEELGFSHELALAYQRLLRNPQGLVLVVGPTGSGKSTTLYAGLQRLARDPTRKVITIEDPIEYAMRGIQQCAARPDIGFDFAAAIRAFLREDPDVILVGEIRDGATALEGIRASQTGHLVLSTLHANDSVDAVQRLFDLGLHPNSIASELIAVVAQRLARRICTACRVPDEPAAELVAEIFPAGLPEGFRCWKGEGCPECSGQGMRGRIAVVEMLQVGRAMRRAISRQPLVDELRELAVEAGLVPMRDAALRLVGQGLVPLEELPRFLTAEQLAGHGAH
ncbi:MAG: protein-L-isoaspartate(D-aspartate) O-methyltransferase [Planctomycetota bacterium]|nr:MAG: protein-L-isoaspartate(D-aspartate) O-methyltransferase [Planctomycetota bacterium]